MELILRTSFVLLAAWIGSKLLWRAAAATRHLLWHAALLVVLAAPLLTPLVPRIALPGLGEASASVEAGIARALQANEMGPAAEGAPRQSSMPDANGRSGVTWTSLAWWGWSAGTLIVGLWFAMSWAGASRTTRGAAAAPAAWQLELSSLAARLQIGREVRLGVLAENTSPLTVGLVAPRILLPPVAVCWSPAERRAVLIHELAHVRRHDLRIQLMTQAACALYWFNPLVWVAARALRRERERACDDEVLRQGAQASTYATCLLNVARLVMRRGAPSAALAMARASELEGRLLSLLADRARGSSRRGRLLVLVTIGVCAVLALGAGAPSAAAPFAQPSAVTPPAANPLWLSTLATHEDALLPDAAERAVSTLQTSPDPSAREQAALALSDADPSSSVGVLARALDDSSADVREKAALALALQSGSRVVAPLIRALGDADPQVREKAAAGLALRRDARVVEPLLAALRDPDAQVREKAALALGTTGDGRARPALEAATRDADPQVREKAVSGLLLLDSPAATGDGEALRSGLRGVLGAVLGAVQ